ncbi:hypothetical protein [Meiothermus granaticius]|uniref:Uncharacterized protein n=1 Tax=Meiothermus granaticius NBRC 107808 TaxID=1227551 RepID=A0A399FFM9_9DEIN|nr:hypothetical protein [Meiothermus granaticius]RIH94011.1 hypothetical protein Mgrana_00097 [Meiothermus granaticius NBRC 107808]GEM88160.1 hypothetical protein MGR01S_27850 [Meiothermus granaticius NBRC 107808]
MAEAVHHRKKGEIMNVNIKPRAQAQDTPGMEVGRLRVLEYLRLERDFAQMVYEHSGQSRWAERHDAIKAELDEILVQQ